MPQINSISDFILTPPPIARSEFVFENKRQPEVITGDGPPDLVARVCIRVARS